MRLLCAAVILAASLVPQPVLAQYPPPPPPGAAAPAALYAPPQLDQMLAPVALYPDPLLTEILTAATYPVEVDAAAQWRLSATGAGLADGALAAAAEQQGWDPSVTSLVAFPQVLAMLDQHLDWTQALGNAFLAQQGDVMDSIQRLRHAAVTAGTLVSSPYETVSVAGPYVTIEPANPQLVYVPVYNPTTIYGAWPYPQYAPDYWGPPPGLGANFTVGALGFSVGIGVVDQLWNWGSWDWRGHDVRIDRTRFAQIEPGRAAPAAATWQFDPAHRRGAPYRDAQSRAKYEAPAAPAARGPRQQYRFFPQAAAPQAAPARAPATPQQRAGEARPQAAPQGEARPQAAPQGEARPQAAPQGEARPQAAPQGEARPQAAPQQRAATPTPRAPQPPQRTVQAARPAPTPPRAPARAPAVERPPSVFQVAPASQARAEAARGAASRQAMTPRPAPAPAPRPAARPAPAPQHAAPAPQRAAPAPSQERRP